MGTGCGDPGDSDAPFPGFPHGVASGDPLADAVILWTRLAPEMAGAEAEVQWVLAERVDLLEPVASGSFIASPDTDWTVKVDAKGLQPGRTYYYRFTAMGLSSPIGRTRTASLDAYRMRIAVVSCASYAHGFFHVYRHLAQEPDLDLVVHLGDYIYEYATGEYGEERRYDPPSEVLSLDDYRRRFRQYRRDTDLQAVHQQHPFACIWDDHEIANNAWRGGALNHMAPNEGDYDARVAAATRAYFEYMPIRDDGTESRRIWRSLPGNLAAVHLLDTRLWGRDEQVQTKEADRAMPDRELLGRDQSMWLAQQLASSEARWNLLAQQVPLSRINIAPDSYAPFNLDQWDGYSGARDRLLNLLEEANGTVVLTGDIHSHWAMEVARDPYDRTSYDPSTGAGAVTVELVVSSVTTPSAPDEASAQAFEMALRELNPHVRYLNFARRGWIVVDVTYDALQADFWVIDGTRQSEGLATVDRSVRMAHGHPRWEQVLAPSASRTDAAALAPDAPARNFPRE